MPEEKYTPNNSFMGMGTEKPKPIFFGRGKIGTETKSEPERVVPETRLVPETSLVNSPQEAYEKTRLVSKTSLVPETSHPHNLWDATTVQNGHNKMPNIVIDQICRHLTPNEQAVFHQLFRLSCGFGKDTCKIGLPKLAERSNMSESAVQKAVKGLQAKGLVAKERADFGRGREQGTVYRVVIPTSLVSDTRLVRETSLVRSTSNKKDLKETIKRESAPPDYKSCPDCDGMGVRYIDPLDYSKGTIKCRHEQMGK